MTQMNKVATGVGAGRVIPAAFMLVSALVTRHSGAAAPWLVYEGTNGPGAGKQIVLISGDEEYRSEEALPMLARILAEHHGFTCTVLFSVEPESGIINPYHPNNIPGLEHLDDSDLMIIFTRFRDLPNDQMNYIDGYLKSGRPVIGLRTATHAFQTDADGPWGRYGNAYHGSETAWEGGFGRLVLGEMWINHHGSHKHESTRGIIADAAGDHPIVRGIESGAIWAPTDVYGVRLPLPGDSFPLVLGQVTTRNGEYDESDLYYGMSPEDKTAVEGPKNDPMMPVAWTKSYQLPGGREGRVFTTTMGASADLTNEALRRLIVNAAYWAVGMEAEIPEQGTNVAIVGQYAPTQFRFTGPEYWVERKLKPEDVR